LREKNSSNSVWVNREGWVSVVWFREEGLFLGRKPMWGRHPDKRSKTIPPIRIRYITKFLPRSKRVKKKIKRSKLTTKWHNFLTFVKSKILDCQEF
jgi:hypothetical protein